MINTKNTRLRLKVNEIDFKKLVTDSVLFLRNLDGAHRLEVKTTIEGHLPFFSDREQLQIIFNSLISNAIKFRHLHEMHPTLIIHVEVNDDTARFIFHDNGIGIAKEHLPKIFNMFYCVPGSAQQGSGLGLYMTREIIKKMKGKIKAESNPGEGTRIIFELPNLIDPDLLRNLKKLIQNS